jgi:hypothetical protein
MGEQRRYSFGKKSVEAALFAIERLARLAKKVENEVCAQTPIFKHTKSKQRNNK